MPELYDNDTPIIETPNKIPEAFKPSEGVRETPRRGETARVSVDDPNMNLSVGNRHYRTVDGGTTIPVADAQKLIDAGVPGVKIIPPMSRGFGPGSRVNGRPRHEYFPGDCACDECKAGK